MTVRILGIDPGLRVTGFGVIDQDGQQLHYVASGCIKTQAGELPERLKAILNSLGVVIAQHKPDQVAIEKVFVNVNPQSTLLLGPGARGCNLRGGAGRSAGGRIYRVASQAGSGR